MRAWKCSSVREEFEAFIGIFVWIRDSDYRDADPNVGPIHVKLKMQCR